MFECGGVHERLQSPQCASDVVSGRGTKGTYCIYMHLYWYMLDQSSMFSNRPDWFFVSLKMTMDFVDERVSHLAGIYYDSII